MICKYCHCRQLETVQEKERWLCEGCQKELYSKIKLEMEAISNEFTEQEVMDSQVG